MKEADYPFSECTLQKSSIKPFQDRNTAGGKAVLPSYELWKYVILLYVTQQGKYNIPGSQLPQVMVQ